MMRLYYKLIWWWKRKFGTRWFKKHSIIKFVLDDHTRPYADQYPIKDGEHCIYLGEISNMRGHIIVSNKEGLVIWGFHPDNFVVPHEDEI